MPRAATSLAVGLALATAACGARSLATPPSLAARSPASPVTFKSPRIPAVGRSDPSAFPPPPHPDPRDVPSSALDLRQVTFGQRETRLELTLRTARNWSATDLADDALCIDLRSRRLAGRVCVATKHRKLVLQYRRVAGTTEVREPHAIPAAIRRRNRRSLFARFHARALGLADGRFEWSVTSRSSADGACAAGCVDRVPDHGEYAAIVSPLAQTPCFGAASRAPGQACENRRLRTSVTPPPSDAVWSPGSPCHPIADPLRSDVLRPCEFGDRDTDQPPALALIGDSHADHWRAAVDVAAQSRGWRAINMTRAGCSFSSEAYPTAALAPAVCHRHSNEAIAWLRAHPSVHTIITSSSAGRGLSASGYLAIWRRVPASVKRIFVLRDIPRMRVHTGDCVSAALRRRLPSAGLCSVARRSALIADTSAQAAASRPARVHLIDLTRVFCDSSRCFPVVGGAYIYKDDNHMNATFAATLGPLLLKQIRG